MNLNEFNSLVDLFFYQAKKKNPNEAFLEWLKPKNKKKYSWGQTSTSIQKLAKVLKHSLAAGDRCLLISENRPEWLIADLSIMLANGITVPAYTTYTEKDYRYLIEDCEPSVVIVSNDEMYGKLKNIIKEKNFILSKSKDNIIPNVVSIAINDDTNNNPFKITSTSSLALLLFFIFLRE